MTTNKLFNVTPAAKLDMILQLLGGQPILDENGEETGELTSAVISKEQALQLLQINEGGDQNENKQTV